MNYALVLNNELTYSFKQLNGVLYKQAVLSNNNLNCSYNTDIMQLSHSYITAILQL